MTSKRRKRWRLIVAVGLMLAAIFAYLASLDEADPDALPAAAEQAEGR
jgi:hypothetical protein